MFAHLLEDKKEKICFVKLCFIVALSDTSGNKKKEAKEFTNKVIQSFTETTSYKFLENYYINDEEASLLEQITTGLDLNVSELEDVIVKAEYFFEESGNNFDTVFKKLIENFSEKNLSLRSKKIILFEMCNMAFKDGYCSEIEKSIIKLTGMSFAIDNELVEEIITESSKLNAIYNTCVEIIME